MSQILRCSPQSVGIDEAHDRAVQVTDNAVRVVDGEHDIIGKFNFVFPSSVEDSSVVSQIKAQVLPQIASRQNVVTVFYGHGGTGKTCLMEQLLPAILEGLKSVVVSADEAHQEALNIGMEDIGSVRRAPSPTLTATKASPSPLFEQDSTQAQSPPTYEKRDMRPSIPRKSVANVNQPKYSLVLARMPRNAAAVEMAQVDTRAIGSPRPLLPKLKSRDAEAGASTVSLEDTSQSPSRWRLAIERARSPIQLIAGSLTSLGSKNGRQAGDHTFPSFNGDGAFFTLDPMHDIDKVLKDPTKVLSISFWVQIEDPSRQQCILDFYDPHEPNYCLTVLANTNDLGVEDAGHTLVTVRDSHGKRLEATFNSSMEDGRWHFVVIQIRTGEKSVSMVVDNKSGRIKSSVGENVSSFHDSRPKCGLVGAMNENAADGTRTQNCFLRGSLMDLTFSEQVSGRKFATYSLRSADGVKDSSFLQEPLRGDVPFTSRFFPQTSPSFDGYDRFINVGPVGDFGLMLPGTTIDICFRTSVTNEKMCLMGVSDTVGKSPGFGIELNTNAQNQLQRYMMTFWLQDRAGNQVRATSELSTAFDDSWHTLSVRLVELDPPKFKVRLDGRHCETSLHSHGNPKDFVAYSQFVSIGALHQKGELWRHFRGSLKQVSVTRVHDDVEEPLATWLLNEGPGAAIAMDATSHGFNGVYFLRNGVKGSCFFPTDKSDGGDQSDDPIAAGNQGKGVTRYSNNMVTMAFVEVRTEIDSVGAVRETVVDLLGKKHYHDLELVPMSSFNQRTARSDPRVFQTVHEECYQRVTPADYMAKFKAAAAKMEDSKTTHTVFVLRIGDASFTLIDLASYKKSPRAAFSAAQLTWTDAVSIFGNANKMHFSINTALSKVDKLLLRCGAQPQLYKRSIFQRPTTKCSSDDFITNIVSFALLAPRESTQLFQIHLFSPKTRATEALQSLLLVDRMREQDRIHAAMVIQKLYRWKKAFCRFSERLKLRKEADSRREKSALMRKQYPKDMLEKEKRLAMVIVCNDFEYDPCMVKCTAKFDDYTVMSRLLEAIGYKCELMLNPSKKNLLEGLHRKKQEQTTSDASLFVHFIGIGGADCFHNPPPAELQRSWLMDNERDARLRILASQRHDMGDYYVDEQYEWNMLVEQLKGEIEEMERKNAKKKKKKDDKTPAIVLPARSSKPSKESVVAIMSKWDSTIAPAVPIAAREEAHMSQMTRTPQTFLCVGDTRAAVSRDNTVTVQEMKSILMSDVPKRGEHVIFSYDCTAFPSPENKTFGFGAMHAASGEGATVQYKQNQSLLLTYYVRRCLQGCAVDCVRVGKNDPPRQVNMEIACRYLRTKLDPTEGRFPCKSLHIDWFGEIVGDMFLAPKILAKKEDRRKIKASMAAKKSLVKVDVMFEVPVRSESRLQMQQKLATILKSATPIEIKKLVVSDCFSAVVPDADFDTLTTHSIVIREIDAALDKLVPGAFKLKWHPQKDPCGLSLYISPLAQPEVKADGESRDQKQIAMEYFVAQEKRAQDIEKKVFGPMAALAQPAATIGRYSVTQCRVLVSIYINLSDEECLKLDRHCRLGGAFTNEGRIVCVRMLSEKEVQDMEQLDRLIQVEEARRQTEAKLRMVKEAEERKKAEEELTRMMQKKDTIVDKVQQLKGLGAVKPEELDFLLSVPLPEAMGPVLELLAQVVAPGTVEGFVGTAQLIPKISGNVVKCTAALQDGRFVAACFKLSTALTTSGGSGIPAAATLCSLALKGCSNSVAVRPLPACIDALAKANATFPNVTALADIASFWGAVVIDNKQAMSATLCTLSASVSDLLHPDVELYFGLSAVRGSLRAVCERTDVDGVEVLLSWITSAEPLDDTIVSAFVASVTSAQSLPSMKSSLVVDGLNRLCDPSTSWSSENCKLFVSAYERFDEASRALQPVEQLLQRLQASL